MKKKKIVKQLIIVVGALGILCLCIWGKTLAKYVIDELHGYYLNTQHFYFTSNRLKRGGATYMVNNWSGVGSFTISFNLLSEKNSLVYTDYDIPYTVEYDCPTGVACSFDKTSGTIFRNSATHSDTVVLSVAPSGSYAEGQRLTIGIKAKSVSPYEEEITATFIYVVGKKGVTWEIEDEVNRPYMILKVTNAINYCIVTEAFGNYPVNYELDSSIYRQLSDTDKAKCAGKEITLSFNPNTVILDTTSSIVNTATISNTTINGVDYVSGLVFEIEPLSTVAIKYYKINNANNYTYPGTSPTSVVNVTVTN